MFIVPLLGNAAFDPETVETLSAAFDDAWQQIKQSGSTFARSAYERARILAKCIIKMAQGGEPRPATAERIRSRACGAKLQAMNAAGGPTSA